MDKATDPDSLRLALGLIGGFLAARLLFVAALGLGVDESYTLAISRSLSLSYFDHPPLHQWIAHFAARSFGEGLAARLPFVILFAATGWLLFGLTRELFGSRAALIALFALNVTPFFFASAGTWILPDGPLLFGLALAALALAKLFFVEAPSRSGVWGLWLVAGAGFGLAGLSKYSAALNVAGLAAFLIAAPGQRRWLRHPAPYAAAALALAMVSPVFIWNAAHGWASFAFQGARGAPQGLKPAQFLVMAVGEVAYLLPWNCLGLVAALTAAWRGRRNERQLFLFCLALPPIVLFTLTPLWGARGLPQWTMPGWFFAYPLMGAWAVKRATPDAVLRRWAFVSAGTLAVAAALFAVQAATGYPMRWLRLPPGVPDPTLESFAWRDLRDAPAFQSNPAFVLAVKWSDAGKIAMALGPGVPVFVISDDPRGFAFVDDGQRFLGRDGVLVARAADLPLARALAGSAFASIGEAQAFTLERNGAPAVALTLVPGKGLTARLPIPYPAPSR
jgi:4-amino-4-deoxy-L-arabinose transferase-like glycosyltransferase